MPKNPTKTGFRFTVDARLVEHLGIELVSKPTIALAELIKNSFDADALEVLVCFSRDKDGTNYIEVVDNGSGMDREAIERYWMRIATPDKVANPYSPKFKRPRAGRKGIGRFAAHRLGSHLTLVTKTPGKDPLFVDFSWDQYKGGEDLDSIDNRATTAFPNRLDHRKSGTLLQIRKLRDTWSAKELKALRGHLSDILTPPFTLISQENGSGLSRRTEMSIRFEGFPEQEEELELSDDVLKSHWAVVEGRVNTRKGISYKLAFRRSGRSRSHFVSKEALDLPLPGDLYFRLYYFNYKREFFRDVQWRISDVAKIARACGGVRIYRDGIRVMPYGEPGNDWLALDKRRSKRTAKSEFQKLLPNSKLSRRTLLDLPANYQLFGAVELTRAANEGFRDLTNREGLLHNESYNALLKVLTIGIDWLTIELHRERQQYKKKQETGDEDLSRRLNELQQAVAEEQELPAPVRRTLLKQVKGVRDIQKKAVTSHLDQLSLYRVLASFGISVQAFGHEVSDDLSAMHDDIAELAIHARGNPKVKKVVKRLKRALSSISGFMKYAGLFAESGKKPRRKPCHLLAAVNAVLPFHSTRAKDRGVTIEDPAVSPQLFVGPLLATELKSVINNLLSNAVKWAVIGTKKRVHISARRAKKAVNIEVLDSGPGISKDNEELVFSPFFTMSRQEDDVEQATSIGLGLTIVREVARSYGGDATVVRYPENKLSGISVLLPSAK